MSAQHTPGPWSVEGPDEFSNYNIVGPDKGAVDVAVVNTLRPDDEAAANAWLIGAAPELLIQLKGLLAFAQFIIDVVELDTDRTTVVLRANGQTVAEVPVGVVLQNTEAAIAKAEGRS